MVKVKGLINMVEFINFKNGDIYPLKCIYKIVSNLNFYYGKKYHCHFYGVSINQVYYEINKYFHKKELYIELVFKTDNGINRIKQTFDSIEELINFIRLYIESEANKYGWLF